MSILGAGIGAVSQIGGGLMNYFGQKSANKTNIKLQNSANLANQQLASDAREHDVAMWNRQNEYNTPEMQMQRLKEAGLNPNLIYEQGAGSAGNASSFQKAPIAEHSPAKVSNELTSATALNMLPMISAYQDWEVKKAQIDNIRAQTQNTESQTIATKLATWFNEKNKPYAVIDALNRSTKLGQETSLANANMLLRDLDYQHNVRTLDSRVNRTLSENKNYEKYGGELQKYSLENSKTINRQRLLDLQFDEEMKPYGVRANDQLWQRMLVPMIMKFLGDPRQLKKR